MKKNEQEQWIDEVFDSWKGSQKAKPNDVLFSEIERQLTPIISIRTVSLASAAAILLLLLNAFIIQQQLNSPPLQTAEQVNYDDQQLISDFKIYD